MFQDKSPGTSISMVAAMLPLAFTMCSAVMGPLIDLTGDAAVPVYYSTVNAALAAGVFSFLKR